MGWDNNHDPEEFAEYYPHLSSPPQPRFPVQYKHDEAEDEE